MQPVPAGFGKSFLQNLVGPQLSIGDRLVDAREILVNYPARAEVQVAYFRVAHLALRQTNIHAARTESRPGISAVKVIVKGSLRQERRIPILLSFLSASGIDPPAIANYQNNRFLAHTCLPFELIRTGQAIKIRRQPRCSLLVLISRPSRRFARCLNSLSENHPCVNAGGGSGPFASRVAILAAVASAAVSGGHELQSWPGDRPLETREPQGAFGKDIVSC